MHSAENSAFWETDKAGLRPLLDDLFGVIRYVWPLIGLKVKPCSKLASVMHFMKGSHPWQILIIVNR